MVRVVGANPTAPARRNLLLGGPGTVPGTGERKMEGWQRGLSHRSYKPTQYLAGVVAGSNPAPSAIYLLSSIPGTDMSAC